MFNKTPPSLTPRTNATHPLQIAVIESPCRGALGVTFAPGKKDPHAPPAPCARGLSTGPDRCDHKIMIISYSPPGSDLNSLRTSL